MFSPDKNSNSRTYRCGKTTIINLLLRFYDINSGKIKISGKDTKDITRSSLRSQFGMVLQDTWLFTGTVAENISYGKPNASREEIIEAAKAVHAHSFIKRLPDGYDTVINEEGADFPKDKNSLFQLQELCLRILRCSYWTKLRQVLT